MALSHAILTALLEENLTGYDLAKKFDVSLGFFWGASHQQIYQELKRLQAQGSICAEEVAQQAKPNKRIYSLTDDGRQALDHWVLAETRPSSGKDELFVKLYNVGYSSTQAIVELVEQRQQQSIAKLALYRKIEARHYANPRALADNKKGVYLALRAGILQSETTLQWCEDSLDLLTTVA